MPWEGGSAGVQPASPTAVSRWPGHPTGPTTGPRPVTQSTADKCKPSAWGSFSPPVPHQTFIISQGKKRSFKICIIPASLYNGICVLHGNMLKVKKRQEIGKGLYRTTSADSGLAKSERSIVSDLTTGTGSVGAFHFILQREQNLRVWQKEGP